MILVGVAHGNVKVGVAILVAVLVADVGEDRTVNAIVINVNALVEPGFLCPESGFCKIGNVDEVAIGAFNFDIANFNFRGIGTAGIYDFRRIGILKTLPSNHGPPKFEMP